MLEELRFVQGAVAKKDFLPALTHFRIENGTVRSFNGDLALSSPIAFDIECSPKAIPFVKAIQNCNETVVLQLTPSGRLNVRSGSFNAYIECTEVETPHVLPEGELVEINGAELISAFKVLQPLIGEDASRPWSNGLLLRGQSAFATNNVILAEYWIGSTFPKVCNIPRECINEMIRIKTPPVSAQISSNSITFHYENKRWIRTGLRSTDWPAVEEMLNRESQPVPVRPEIFKALGNIEPFSDKMGRVYIFKNILSTCMEEGEGARFEIPDLGFEGVYQIGMLRLIEPIAKQIDFSNYPAPSTFFGDRVRGLIIGLRS